MMRLIGFNALKLCGMAILLGLGFGLAQANGAELSSEVKQSKLTVLLANIDYPAQFVDKELDSGLPNTVTIYMTLTQNQKLIHGLTINYQVVYDLWDEVYMLDKNASDGRAQKLRFATKEALISYLSAIKQDDFYAQQLLGKYTNLELSAQVIVNPIKAERIKKIQAWIASSKGFEVKASDSKRIAQVVSNSPTGSVGADASTSSGPRFQKLFDQILEQYVKGDDIPALWRSDKLTIEVR